MVQGAVGDDGSGDCDEDAAADVTDKVDESGDLVALLFGDADVCCRGDGDEAEGNWRQLHYAQP